MSKEKSATKKELQEQMDGLRRDFDALANVLKVRDAQILSLEQGRESTNRFMLQQIVPTLNRMAPLIEWHEALLTACTLPTGIPAMRKINVQIIAKAKREARKRQREAAAKAAAQALAAPPAPPVAPPAAPASGAPVEVSDVLASYQAAEAIAKRANRKGS